MREKEEFIWNQAAHFIAMTELINKQLTAKMHRHNFLIAEINHDLEALQQNKIN